MDLNALLKPLNFTLNINTEIVITGLSIDSRTIMPGNLFFAYKGEQHDGRNYINDAIHKGAAAILQESDTQELIVKWQAQIPIIQIPNLQQKVGLIAAEFYSHPSRYMNIIGITGTNGKTSCSHLMASALTKLNCLTGVIGTLGNGLIHAIKPGTHTTPDPISLQAILADLHHQKAQAVAMEVSSHALHQGRVNGVDFNLAIFTNLTRDHLDYHQTMEAYQEAKKLLFLQPGLQYAVMNADDPVGCQWLNEFSGKLQVCGYTIRPDKLSAINWPLVSAEKINLTTKGIEAYIRTPWGEGELYSRLLGLFNLQNILAVISSLGLLKIPLTQILQIVPQLKPIPGRMQTIGGGNLPLLVIDYAHTPDALQQVLTALSSHCEGKLLCLFGCGGNRDRGKRPMMAKIAEQYADKVIVTSDNPRFEDPQTIIDDVLAGFSNYDKVSKEPDRETAIACIIEQAKVGDIVLLAGKGHENYQVIADEHLPFCDLLIAQKYLNSRKEQDNVF